MSFEGGRGRDGEMRGGGEFSDGRSVSHGTVGWFLDVSAVFIVITVYFYKAYYLIHKRKQKQV